MQGASRNLFSGAGLARNQNGSATRAHQADEMNHLADLAAFSDQQALPSGGNEALPVAIAEGVGCMAVPGQQSAGDRRKTLEDAGIFCGRG